MRPHFHPCFDDNCKAYKLSFTCSYFCAFCDMVTFIAAHQHAVSLYLATEMNTVQAVYSEQH